MIDFLIDIFIENKDKIALIWKDDIYTYDKLVEKIIFWILYFHKKGLKPGDRVSIHSEPSPNAIAAFLALIKLKTIVAPLSGNMVQKSDEYCEIAEINCKLFIEDENVFRIERFDSKPNNELIIQLITNEKPGLVLFSSGTTGKSKGAIHDLSKLLVKYHTKRQDLSTIAFMHYDHIGGIDTLFYSLSNGSTIFLSYDRSPSAICQAIETFKLQVLPTTPSFLNLLVLSKVYENYDLSSIKYVTYGAETMPETTLKKAIEIFPNVVFLQKYGTTEVGTLRSKSKSNDSLWVKIGGAGFETRVVDDILQIKADSAMLGYLNANSPFTEDGWFITGDKVETSGEYFRILGRETDIINVGGEKVFPAEVESVIMEIPGIVEVSVFGEPNPILRNIVCAKITLLDDNIDKIELKKKIKTYCSEKLQSFKVPVKIKFVSSNQVTDRFKKIRKADD